MQLATLAAIQDYNKSLPKSRRVKDALPEIATTNIAATYTVKKDLKKGTVEMITKYHQVGIEDGGRASSTSAERFSLSAKQSAIQRSASAKKIAKLRLHYGELIGSVTPSKAADPLIKPVGAPESSSALPEVDNPFSQETLNSDISLSVFSNPK